MIFIDNKYTKYYNDIIKNAQERHLPEDVYVEKHHIIPRSLGGDNRKTNLVLLTAREHFVCHLLLIKMTEKQARFKMLSAVTRFRQVNSKQQRAFTSWEYKKIRECAISARTGQKHSIETRQKIKDKHHDVTGSNNPMYGKLGADNPKSKRLIAIDPGGVVYDVVGINHFSRQHNLTCPLVVKTAQGLQTHHKGWRFKYYS